jgi:dGTPase
LGHDLGHTPYGHAGEKTLNKFTPFSHNEQSLRTVDVLENDGRGMNLTFEVRDGILNHTSKGDAGTLEGHVVAWSDRIAYINHDIDDAVRGGVLSEKDIPKEYISALGAGQSKRINSMTMDIINNSAGKNFVEPSENMKKLIGGLRQFMFDRVYTDSKAKAEEQKAVDMIAYLYEHFLKNLSKIPKVILELESGKEQKVCDYISMMSDQYAVRVFGELAIPKAWNKL